MIKFIDLNAQQLGIREKIEKRIKIILDHGQYIQGPEIKQLESKLSHYTNSKYVLCCSSGTDALLLSLLGLELKPKEAVLVPSFTFASSAEAISLLGAIPIFVDVDKRTFNICPSSIANALKIAKSLKLQVKGIMTVGLFGQPCDIDLIREISKENKLWILDDAAQSFGANYKDRKVGNLAEVTATSFFPSKPLGCYGDGGALFTNDSKIYDIAYSSHLHGMGKEKYKYERLGFNGRMDSFQAGVLLEKLKIFNRELKLRNKIANMYNKIFTKKGTSIILPELMPDVSSTWAQYTIVLSEKINREHFQKKLSLRNIPTAIYYPIPLHKQKPYKDYPISSDNLINTETLSQKVISLPMHPYLSNEDINYICLNVDKTIQELD